MGDLAGIPRLTPVSGEWGEWGVVCTAVDMAGIRAWAIQCMEADTVGMAGMVLMADMVGWEIQMIRILFLAGWRLGHKVPLSAGSFAFKNL